MKFLNSNYPNKCTITPGRSKKLRLSITIDGIRLVYIY